MDNNLQLIFKYFKELFAVNKKNNDLGLELKTIEENHYNELKKKIDNIENNINIIREQNNTLINLLSIKNQSNSMKKLIHSINNNLTTLKTQMNTNVIQENTTENINNLIDLN